MVKLSEIRKVDKKYHQITKAKLEELFVECMREVKASLNKTFNASKNIIIDNWNAKIEEIDDLWKNKSEKNDSSGEEGENKLCPKCKRWVHPIEFTDVYEMCYECEKIHIDKDKDSDHEEEELERQLKDRGDRDRE